MKRFCPSIWFFGLILSIPLISYAQIEEVKPIEEANPYVALKDNLLSVQLQDAEFGTVMKDIANKAGFQVDISLIVYNRKLSTTFNDVEIMKGILRLLTLIGEKNYSIYYDEKGAVSRLEIWGGEQKPKPAVPPKKLIPTQRQTPKPPVSQAPTQVLRPMPETIIPPPPLSPEEAQEIENMMDEPYPYIPPKEEPQYIPKKKD